MGDSSSHMGGGSPNLYPEKEKYHVDKYRCSLDG
jgi:hypothetical protein